MFHVVGQQGETAVRMLREVTGLEVHVVRLEAARPVARKGARGRHLRRTPPDEQPPVGRALLLEVEERPGRHARREAQGEHRHALPSPQAQGGEEHPLRPEGRHARPRPARRHGRGHCRQSRAPQGMLPSLPPPQRPEEERGGERQGRSHARRIVRPSRDGKPVPPRAQTCPLQQGVGRQCRRHEAHHPRRLPGREGYNPLPSPQQPHRPTGDSPEPLRRHFCVYEARRANPVSSSRPQGEQEGVAL